MRLRSSRCANPTSNCHVLHALGYRAVREKPLQLWAASQMRQRFTGRSAPAYDFYFDCFSILASTCASPHACVLYLHDSIGDSMARNGDLTPPSQTVVVARDFVSSSRECDQLSPSSALDSHPSTSTLPKSLDQTSTSPSPLHVCPRRLSDGIVSHTTLLYNANLCSVSYLEVTLRPVIVKVFHAVHNRPSSQRRNILTSLQWWCDPA